ncbi:MAG: TrkA C-terminal domain-containing protein [Pyrobaculum sp.]
MAREALLLDSNDDLTIQMSRTLVDNGYVVRILATRDRAKQFEKIPVYIHLLTENYEKILKDIDFEKIEIAIFPSPNDMLNLTFARVAKSQGVPIVIITARNNAVAKQAEEEGIEVVVPYHCVISRLLRMLNLKFTRIIPLKGEVAILEMLVTSDSKLLGKKIGEIEEGTGAKVAAVRGDAFLTSPEEELQEGDYVVAIGPQADLQELTE